MGSRAIVIVCRDEDVARWRFGVVDEGFGICYTRTGRRFFDDLQLEQTFLERIRDATNTARLFDELASDWLLLDCELMPWSAKAQQLLREQYAAVGAAGRAALAEAVNALDQAAARDGRSCARERAGRPAALRESRHQWVVINCDDLPRVIQTRRIRGR
jgi:protein phosphatase